MSKLEAFQSFAPEDRTFKTATNKAVIYTRVSHSSQEDNTSLESQKKYCENFAQRKGLDVVGYFGGTYESAKTDDRKEFKRMLKFIRQSKNVSHVVVYSYERFSRSGVGGAKIADDLLREYGVVTLAVTQELDPTTASGSFQQKILFLFSQMDNELRRDKTITGMSELLRKGFTPYSIPRGYSNLNKGRAVDQEIVVNSEGRLIRKAFMWKAKKQMSNMDIVRKLRSIGMKIDKRRLGEIFANPYYCGVIVSKMIPGEVIEGRHEPMVSKSVFLQVNEIILNNRSHPSTHKDTDENLPLKKFLVCGECETPMTGFLVKKKGLYYYKCRTTGCKHTMSAKKLHEQFQSLLSMFQIDEENVEFAKAAVISYYDAYFEEVREERNSVRKKLADLETQLKTIKKRHALGEIDKEIYLEFKAEFEKELEEITQKSEFNDISSSNLEKCLDYALDYCLKPSSKWVSRNVEGKISLQKMLFPNGIRLFKQNKEVQTFGVNSLFAPIADIARAFRENKKGQPINFDQLSFSVTTIGFKPITS